MAQKHPHITCLQQKNFDYVGQRFQVATPEALRPKKFDHAIISGTKATNIEVNFYGGPGSKPSEIVKSYIDRQRDLKAAGWRFVWLTDGAGWKSMQNPLRDGVDHIDYVINAHLLRVGLLEEIVLRP